MFRKIFLCQSSKKLLVLMIAKEYQNNGLTEGELVDAGFNGD